MSAADNARKLLAIVLAAPAVMLPPILLSFDGIWRESWLLLLAFVFGLVANVFLAVGVWRLALWAPAAACAWLVAVVCWFAAFFTVLAKAPTVFDFGLLVCFVAFGVWLTNYLHRTARKAVRRNDNA